MLARNVMTPNPSCCKESDSARQAAKIMKQQDVGSVPIYKDDQDRTLTGIVTDRDLCLSVLAEGKSPDSPLREVMHRNPVACSGNHSIEDCLSVMQENQIRRLPVVDEQNRCIGIIAQADIALHLGAEATASTVAEISRPGSTRQRKVA